MDSKIGRLGAEELSYLIKAFAISMLENDFVQPPLAPSATLALLTRVKDWDIHGRIRENIG